MPDEQRLAATQGGSNEANGTLAVYVWRGDENGGTEQRFDVPRQESQTVLDVVTWIQQQADASLTYRFACRVGMCGSCAMMVNDEPRWTCRTHVGRVARNGELHIAPLRNLPVIKDLVTDMDPFFDKWVKAEAIHHPSAGRSDAFAAVTPDILSASRPAPESNASIVRSAMRPATRLPATRTISDPPPCNGHGRSITTPATMAAMPSSTPFPSRAAVTAVIRWEAAPIIVRTIWTRWAPSPG